MNSNQPEPLFVIRNASVDDAEEIFSLMKTVQSNLSEKSIYVISDADRIRYKLSTDCFGYLFYCKEKLVAFYLFQKPKSDDRDNNLGYYLGLSDKQRTRVLILDSVAVLKPFRRMGISSFLLNIGINRSRELNCEYIITTVDPRNQANLKCLIKHGFRIAKTIKTYTNADHEFVLHLSGMKQTNNAQIGDGIIRYVLIKDNELKPNPVVANQ